MSKWWLTVCFGTVFFAASAVAAPPTMQDVRRLGTLVELDGAQLYIPHTASAVDGQIDVVVHFHGGLAYLAREIERYGFNTVLVYVSPGGLSSAYRVPFEDGERFGRLLDGARATLRAQDDWAEDVAWGKVVVTSFSAGYGAVRELLKSEDYVERIDGVLLCDSLYASYAPAPTPAPGSVVGVADARRVNPQQMESFVAYARLAAAGEKHFTFTHSYIVPAGYAGTHETADFLAAALGMEWEAVDLEGPGGMRRDREAKRGRFTLVGGTGDDAIAHVIHLHEAGYFLNEMGLLGKVAAADSESE